MANDEARAAAREWLSDTRGSIPVRLADSLADLLTRYAAKAVLREAEWWREWGAEAANCPKFCLGCKKLAALKEQAKPGV